MSKSVSGSLILHAVFFHLGVEIMGNMCFVANNILRRKKKILPLRTQRTASEIFHTMLFFRISILIPGEILFSLNLVYLIHIFNNNFIECSTFCRESVAETRDAYADVRSSILWRPFFILVCLLSKYCVVLPSSQSMVKCGFIACCPINITAWC